MIEMIENLVIKTQSMKKKVEEIEINQNQIDIKMRMMTKRNLEDLIGLKMKMERITEKAEKNEDLIDPRMNLEDIRMLMKNLEEMMKKERRKHRDENKERDERENDEEKRKDVSIVKIEIKTERVVMKMRKKGKKETQG